MIDWPDMRTLISSGSPYEPKVGISRAVRVGSIIAVSGTAPLGPDGKTVGRGDPAAQARRCLDIIKAALEQAGASLDQVVRTRTLLTRIEDWQAVAAVHGEYFGAIRPANTIMQVTRFIDPDWLIEFEADAVVEEGR
jgi:enamine deaminase RidA (YjgF/YER057c/UK114 family)